MNKPDTPSVHVRISGVADILGGISRQAANKHTQGDSFPTPAYTDELGRCWYRSDVEAYQAQRTSDTQEGGQ